MAAAARDGESGSTAPRPRNASVTVHRNEVYVEVQDAGAIDLVDRALILALLEAGVAAEKEGPHVTTMVSPAICFGKVRVSDRGEEHLRRHLETARNAAVGVLTAAQCKVADD